MHLSGIPAKEWLISNKELLILNPFIPSITQWGAGGFFLAIPYISKDGFIVQLFSVKIHDAADHGVLTTGQCPYCSLQQTIVGNTMAGRQVWPGIWRTTLLPEKLDRNDWKMFLLEPLYPRSRAYPGESKKKTKKLYYVLFYSHFYDIND